ncbi:MAG: T9SS type A sorting domain-containing protein [Ignavibacteriales bacterium]|nr:T9SS type A sorting domain-containing protein [Ignavibacteriales bacterium]
MSIARNFTVTAMQAPRTSYTNNFNTSGTDFTSNGFTLSTPVGFSSQAYHSPHPYSNNKNYTLALNIPIIVSSSNAFVRFDEIALVEPGDPGSVFGDANFYDFCVVEASKDGSTWLPLEDGWDARRDATWESAWNSNTNGAPSMIKNHQMSLLSKFSPGDLVTIRFRLYTDAGATGWGWMIDNLEIQASLVSVEQGNAAIPTSYGLAQNYPNPFNPSTTIRFALPAQSKVSLKIYDGIGREVYTVLNKELPAGYYAENWNAAGLASGVYFYRLLADDISATGKRSFVETKKLMLIK